MFNDDHNHFAKYETIRKLSKEIFDDLAQICLKKFNVKLKQNFVNNLNEITIRGKNFLEAKAFLIQKLPEL